MNEDNIESVRDSEARFRAIFENAAVGIARVSSDGRFLDFNQRLCDIVGYTPEELMAKHFSDITHPDDLETDLGIMRRMLAGEMDTYLREKRYCRKDGSEVWANLNVSAMRKADGSLDYFVSVVEDISSRKRAEEKLRQRDERLLLASRTAGLGIFEWDYENDRAIWENDRMYEIFGHSRADGEVSKDEFLRRYILPDDVAAFEREFNVAIQSRALFHTVYRIHRKDGALRWLETTGNFAFAADGRPIRMIGVLADITERQQAEEKLRSSEEQFRLLADTAPALIWSSGTDKLRTFINKPLLAFTGRTMEAELGNGWWENIHPDDFNGVLEIYDTSFSARNPFKMEYRLRRYDGEYRWLLDHGVPRFSPGGNFLGYIGSCIDITDRKRAEAEHDEFAQEQAARAAAEYANRAKDEFLAMVSHELRSPLTAILGYTRLLRSGSLDTEATNKATAIVERNAKAQLQIIEDLLDSARIITGKLRIEPVPIDLCPLLEAAVDTVRTAAEAKAVALIADVGPGPQQVLGDFTRLQQIVWNLLSNAIKFTPEGGRVELRLEPGVDHVGIIVSDTGKGIEPEFLPFVFERFLQADSSSAKRLGGLGLGLSLTKHLIELHGGTIKAASEGLGRGATFTVTLPRRNPEFVWRLPAVTRREFRRSPDALALEQNPSLDGIDVLIVDDQEEARAVLTQTIGEYGARVTAVSSGAEALALLANQPRDKWPDVLILDILMPDEDGYTVLKKVRALELERGEADGEIPAIALTAYDRSQDRLRALQAGFHTHVAKPVEPAELAVVIASLTSRRIWERGRNQ